MRPVLLSALVLALVLGTVHFLHPKGLGGFVKLGQSAEAETGGPGSGDAPPVMTTAGKGVLAARELEKAYRAYDRGDFNDAVTFFSVGVSVAADDTKRAKAQTGLYRSLLARAAIRGAEASDESQYTALAETAELDGSQEQWFAALRAAAGAGLKGKLAYAFEQLLDYSIQGGPLERHVVAIATAEPNAAEANRLFAALEANGLGPKGRGGSKTGSGVTVSHDPWGDDDDDGTGGIGSVGNYKPTRIRVPFGSFSPQTRKRLERACELEAEGKHEYDLAAPDKANRGKHRKAALAKLTQARDIYDDALLEDETSSGLQARYGAVIRLIAFLRKDSTSSD